MADNADTTELLQAMEQGSITIRCMNKTSYNVDFEMWWAASLIDKATDIPPNGSAILERTGIAAWFDIVAKIKGTTVATAATVALGKTCHLIDRDGRFIFYVE